MSKEVRKAVAYFRISSGADRYGLKFQEAAIEAYAKTAGHDIVGTYYTAAVSGGADPHALGLHRDARVAPRQALTHSGRTAKVLWSRPR